MSLGVVRQQPRALRQRGDDLFVLLMTVRELGNSPVDRGLPGDNGKRDHLLERCGGVTATVLQIVDDCQCPARNGGRWHRLDGLTQDMLCVGQVARLREDCTKRDARALVVRCEPDSVAKVTDAVLPPAPRAVGKAEQTMRLRRLRKRRHRSLEVFDRRGGAVLAHGGGSRPHVRIQTRPVAEQRVGSERCPELLYRFTDSTVVEQGKARCIVSRRKDGGARERIGNEFESHERRWSGRARRGRQDCGRQLMLLRVGRQSRSSQIGGHGIRSVYPARGRKGVGGFGTTARGFLKEAIKHAGR